MNAPQVDADGDDLPLLDDIEGQAHRHFTARARADGAGVLVTSQVLAGSGYVMSSEHPVDDLTVAEATQLRDALTFALEGRERWLTRTPVEVSEA